MGRAWQGRSMVRCPGATAPLRLRPGLGVRGLKCFSPSRQTRVGNECTEGEVWQPSPSQWEASWARVCPEVTSLCQHGGRRQGLCVCVNMGLHASISGRGGQPQAVHNFGGCLLCVACAPGLRVCPRQMGPGTHVPRCPCISWVSRGALESWAPAPGLLWGWVLAL